MLLKESAEDDFRGPRETFARFHNLGGSGFATPVGNFRRCTRCGFSNWQNFGLSWRAPFHSSDDRTLVRARNHASDEPVFITESINQSYFPRTQHLLRQRTKIAKSPHQISALHKIRLNISRSDRRVQLQNAIGKFVNPHRPVTLNAAKAAAAMKRALLHHRRGIGKQSFYFADKLFRPKFVSNQAGSI